MLPHQVDDALMGFIEQSSRFLKGVYAGDTIYPALEITELLPQRTTGVVVMRATVHNQRGELVLDGMHKYLLRKRYPDKKE
jgi:acyl dehydratase